MRLVFQTGRKASVLLLLLTYLSCPVVSVSGTLSQTGMRKVVLQRNVINGVNTLTQSSFADSNTIYVIQNDYVLGSNVTIPVGCVLKFDGGSIAGDKYKLTVQNTQLDGSVKILCDFNGRFANPQLNIDWFGAVRSRYVTEKGVDNSKVLQRVLTNCTLNGNVMLIPIGKYIYSETISTTGLTARQMPSIKGETPARDFAIAHSTYMESSMLVFDGANNKAAIYIDGGNAGLDGGTLENFSIYRENPREDDGTVGLRLNKCINYRIINVSIQGFGVGLYNTMGWSWRAFGLTCTQNHTGVRLDDNSNAVSLIGCQLHQNGFVGVYICGGTGINIEGATLEGQPFGICVDADVNPSNSVSNLELCNCYFEQNPQRDIVVGASVAKKGKNYEIKDNTQAVSSVSINQCNTVSDAPQPIPVYIGTAKNVKISNYSFGGDVPLTTISKKAYDVSINNQHLYRANEVSRTRRVNYNNKNILINGFNEYGYSTCIPGGTFETINGVRYAKYLITPGTKVGFSKRLYPDEFEDGVTYMLSGVGYTTGGSVFLNLYNHDYYRAIASAGQFTSNGQPMIGARINGSEIREQESNYYNLTLYFSNDTKKDQYLYVESLYLAPVGTTEFSSSESINCLSGSVKATPKGVELAIPYGDGYIVIATNTGALDAQIRVVKGNKKITIYSSVETTVDYSIIRK